MMPVGRGGQLSLLIIKAERIAIHLVELLDRLEVHERSSVVEDPHAVVDPQPRTESSAHQVTSIGTPLAMTGIGRVESADLLERFAIPNVDLTR